MSVAVVGLHMSCMYNFPFIPFVLRKYKKHERRVLQQVCRYAAALANDLFFLKSEVNYEGRR